MPVFNVKCFERGIWDEADSRKVEANDAREAAESVCGGPLIDAGKPGQLRAQVWEPSAPRDKTLFYVPS